MNLQQYVALGVGGILMTLLGVAGFFVSGTLLVFDVNTLHNIIHILTGLLGITAGLYAAGKFASLFNKGFGAIYILVSVLGFFLPDLMRQLINNNTSDTIFHFVIGVGLVLFGFLVKEGAESSAPPAEAPKTN